MQRTRRVEVEARRWGTARRWAVAVLVVATLAMAGHLALVVVATSMAAWVIEVVRPGAASGLDVVGLVLDSLPALLVGWCTGLAVTAATARGEALGARSAGVVGGAVGVGAGVAVLRVTCLV